MSIGPIAAARRAPSARASCSRNRRLPPRSGRSSALAAWSRRRSEASVACWRAGTGGEEDTGAVSARSRWISPRGSGCPQRQARVTPAARATLSKVTGARRWRPGRGAPRRPAVGWPGCPGGRPGSGSVWCQAPLICSTGWCGWRCWGRNSAVVMHIGQVRQALACGQRRWIGRPPSPLGSAWATRPSRCLAQAASASGPSGSRGMVSPVVDLAGLLPVAPHGLIVQPGGTGSHGLRVVIEDSPDDLGGTSWLISRVPSV
jgi:hypothetical protein